MTGMNIPEYTYPYRLNRNGYASDYNGLPISEKHACIYSIYIMGVAHNNQTAILIQICIHTSVINSLTEKR